MSASNVLPRPATPVRILSLARAAWPLVILGAELALVAVLVLMTAPQLLGFKSLVVRSGSMSGTADTGSLVLARPVDATDVSVGDVIVLQKQRDGAALPPVLHRVIERQIDENGEIVVMTKGDANPAPDADPTFLRGKTLTSAFVLPGLGFVVAAMRTTYGWFGFLFVAVTFTAVSICQIWSSEGSGKGQRPGAVGSSAG